MGNEMALFCLNVRDVCKWHKTISHCLNIINFPIFSFVVVSYSFMADASSLYYFEKRLLGEKKIKKTSRGMWKIDAENWIFLRSFLNYKLPSWIIKNPNQELCWGWKCEKHLVVKFFMNVYKPLGTIHKNNIFSNENIIQPTISQKNTLNKKFEWKTFSI